MKKKHVLLSIVTVLYVMLLSVFLLYGIWTTSVYSNLRVAFPEGTLVVRDVDTHRGIFRSKGVAVIVAQIPKGHTLEFEEILRAKGFSEGPPVGRAYDLLSSVDEMTGESLRSTRTMVNYEDEALAFVEEPFSDCSAAIYDLGSGLFCYIEYDE